MRMKEYPLEFYLFIGGSDSNIEAKKEIERSYDNQGFYSLIFL